MINTLTRPTDAMVKVAQDSERLMDEVEDLYYQTRGVSHISGLSDNTADLFEESAEHLRRALDAFRISRSRLIGALQTHACEGWKKEVDNHDK